MPIEFHLPLQSTADVSVRTPLPRGNVRAKRSAEAGLHERMDDMLIFQTAENSYPTTVDALRELYQSITVIKNEKMANEVYGLLFVAKKIFHQAEYLLAAARLAKADLATHEDYIKQNKFSARHLRKLKNVSEDLRNDVVKEAWNVYQFFRIFSTIAKFKKRIEAIIKKISKTYDQKHRVAVSVVEEELSKNSHVLGLTEQKLNKIRMIFKTPSESILSEIKHLIIRKSSPKVILVLWCWLSRIKTFRCLPYRGEETENTVFPPSSITLTKTL
ncbi:hypothetical protein SGGMMB4_03659 [Sodalis glossinidius str. 'morsitans']|nr:hypothetical protein [Sodalis glossinidius]CRL45681.1 hypothetical protein SGGMMB4_03659 [Sodalis glossinidius str. 'morsitans']